MKFKQISVCAILVAALLLQVGCKKDKDEDTREYLTGSLSLKAPIYVAPGYTKEYCIDSLMTLTRSDGGSIGYYFTDPVEGKRDTLVTQWGVVRKQHFSFTAPDKIGNYSMTLGAFAEPDYYGTSTSAAFSVVKSGFDAEGCSITKFGVSPQDSIFTDPRDDEKYYYTTIGATDWMRNNLSWKGAGRAYGECDVMSDIFGRYYTWDEAQSACPDGWRLPSDADWLALAGSQSVAAQAQRDIPGFAGKLMGDIYFNDTKMWEYWREVKITNATRLSVMPVGYAAVEGNKYSFSSVFTYAAFWLSDSEDEDTAGLRYIFHNKDIVYYGSASKSDFAASVRCVRDTPTE